MWANKRSTAWANKLLSSNERLREVLASLKIRLSSEELSLAQRTRIAKYQRLIVNLRNQINDVLISEGITRFSPQDENEAKEFPVANFDTGMLLSDEIAACVGKVNAIAHEGLTEQKPEAWQPAQNPVLRKKLLALARLTGKGTISNEQLATLNTLNEKGVEYVVIADTAAALYGTTFSEADPLENPVITSVADTPGNRLKLGSALKAVDSQVAGLGKIPGAQWDVLDLNEEFQGDVATRLEGLSILKITPDAGALRDVVLHLTPETTPSQSYSSASVNKSNFEFEYGGKLVKVPAASQQSLTDHFGNFEVLEGGTPSKSERWSQSLKNQAIYAPSSIGRAAVKQ